MNNVKTTLLLVLLTVLFVAIGFMLGGRAGMVIAFAFAIVLNFVSYWFSDKIVLKMYRARPATESGDSRLMRIVRVASQQARLPMPKVYVIPTEAPNAFATGRSPKKAAVAATEGLMRMLKDDELEGVIGHELAHVKNRDTLVSTVAATIAGAIGMLAAMARWGAILGGFGRDDDNGGIIGLLVMAIVAPIAAMMIQMAISRTREYKADKVGSEITHKPLPLASALKKLHTAPVRMNLDRRPSTAHLFIANTLSGKGFTNLFSTHPPVEERIKRLEQMAGIRRK